MVVDNTVQVVDSGGGSRGLRSAVVIRHVQPSGKNTTASHITILQYYTERLTQVDTQVYCSIYMYIRIYILEVKDLTERVPAEYPRSGYLRNHE